jgi:hypothetical protein
MGRIKKHCERRKAGLAREPQRLKLNPLAFLPQGSSFRPEAIRCFISGFFRDQSGIGTLSIDNSQQISQHAPFYRDRHHRQEFWFSDYSGLTNLLMKSNRLG